MVPFCFVCCFFVDVDRFGVLALPFMWSTLIFSVLLCQLIFLPIKSFDFLHEGLVWVQLDSEERCVSQKNEMTSVFNPIARLLKSLSCLCFWSSS